MRGVLTVKPTVKTLWAACAIGALVVLGVMVDRGLERAGMPVALEGAQRIWWPQERDVGRVAFWAVRDFELEAEQLEMGARSARLIVLGDPEVMVYWNGILVHASRFRVGQPAQVLEVGGLLRPRNRVVLEGRSATGAGGLLAALWLDLPTEGSPGAGPVWVTDESWLATDRHSPDLLQGLEPLSMARESMARESMARESSAPGSPALRPVATWDVLGLGRWQPLRLADRHLPPSWPSRRLERNRGHASEHRGQPMERGETPPWPGGTIYSFDGAVSGCLAVSGGAAFPRRAFFVGDPAVFEEFRGAVEWTRTTGGGPRFSEDWVLPLRGADSWLDAAPRHFGAVLLTGLDRAEPETGVWVQPCAARSRPRPAQRLLGSR